MIYTENVNKALIIAYNCHSGQKDKAGIPYIMHPIHLAEKLEMEDEVIVALLHDAYEDNRERFIQEIMQHGSFSKHIMEAIRTISRNSDINSGKSYNEYIESVKKNRLAHIVKIQDLRHNLDKSRFKGTNNGISKDLEDRYERALNILGNKIVLESDGIVTRQSGKKYELSKLAKVSENIPASEFHINIYPYKLKFRSNCLCGYDKGILYKKYDRAILDLTIEVEFDADAVVSSNAKGNRERNFNYSTILNSRQRIRKVTKRYENILENRVIDIAVEFDIDTLSIKGIKVIEII